MKMYDGLNKMLTGDYLLHKMSIYPEYNYLYIKKFDPCIRLNELSKIYDIYVPTKMTIEIYVQLYLSLIKSLNKKCTMAAQKQRYCSLQNGVIGGADSFTILGDSGIGKSTAINVAIKQIINSQIIEIQHPYSKVIPFLTVQCPYDSSVRSMLLEILRQIDEVFKTDNYSHAIKQRLTIDVLIGKKDYKDIILGNTLLPFYIFFKKTSFKKNVYKKMYNRNTKVEGDLRVGSKYNIKLKYCPLCVKEDKNKYGVSYWHRIHQIPIIDVCPLHFCNLVQVDLSISRNRAYR